MRSKPPRTKLKSDVKPNDVDLDKLFEEYISKLEQKVVSQTRQLKTITDNATSSLFLIDINGKPTFMNPAAERTIGYNLDEIKDRALHKFIHTAHSKSASPLNKCPIIIALKNMHQVRDQEDILVRKDGSLFPVSFSLAPFNEDGKSKGAVLEFQDITKRKELERQKDDFIGVASHELKTPVTSLKSFAQVLHLRFKKEGNVKAAELLLKMDAQVNKLTNLIGDLLDVTKIETGRVQYNNDNFSFDDLLSELVEEMQRTTQKHTLIHKGKTGKKIYADKERIRQVLTNLISNAIKYSPHTDKIIIYSSSEKGQVKVCVQDFGVGIPNEKQEKVFERFFRISGPGKDTYPGLGLGLYISSEIIKRQGGKLWVDSKEGKGSIFCFTLPVKRSKRKQKRIKPEGK